MEMHSHDLDYEGKKHVRFEDVFFELVSVAR